MKASIQWSRLNAPEHMLHYRSHMFTTSWWACLVVTS